MLFLERYMQLANKVNSKNIKSQKRCALIGEGTHMLFEENG
jgi:hypothetical protein